MKIGFITIMLLFFSLMAGFSWYADNVISSSQVGLCNALKPADIINALDSEVEEWGECLRDQRVVRMKTTMMMFVTFIFFWLAFLSWRFDLLEKH